MQDERVLNVIEEQNKPENIDVEGKKADEADLDFLNRLQFDKKDKIHHKP
jgi:hypothetical protein